MMFELLADQLNNSTFAQVFAEIRTFNSIFQAYWEYEIAAITFVAPLNKINVNNFFNLTLSNLWLFFSWMFVISNLSLPYFTSTVLQTHFTQGVVGKYA